MESFKKFTARLQAKGANVNTDLVFITELRKRYSRLLKPFMNARSFAVERDESVDAFDLLIIADGKSLGLIDGHGHDLHSSETDVLVYISDNVSAHFIAPYADYTAFLKRGQIRVKVTLEGFTISEEDYTAVISKEGGHYEVVIMEAKPGTLPPSLVGKPFRW